ncbi:biotin--[acetyl-CoA-carboxylase] ligase [Candidatus Electronema sp. PJ]|uniref:biotin--[acetyl-CoA-carboxylase] ligase n=1 Tax=Candidatus Electronema sp. PJ TaxID=3401572 RepID=UPI003AA94547
MFQQYPVLDSTSSLALDLAQQGAEQGTVVQADQQTGGRGRGGRSFASPLGGLYFSLIVRPALEPGDFPLLTLAAGVGLSRGIKQATGVQVQLKWPNDLYVADRKLGGILTESGPLRGGLPEFVVIGVGINVATLPEQFPLDLRGRIISLAELGVAYHPIDLLPPLCEALLVAVKQLQQDKAAVLAEWRQRDYLLGRPLEYYHEGQVLSAIGAGLAEDGRYLVLDQQQVEHRVTAGDLNPIKVAALRPNEQ